MNQKWNRANSSLANAVCACLRRKKYEHSICLTVLRCHEVTTHKVHLYIIDWFVIKEKTACVCSQTSVYSWHCTENILQRLESTRRRRAKALSSRLIWRHARLFVITQQKSHRGQRLRSWYVTLVVESPIFLQPARTFFYSLRAFFLTPCACCSSSSVLLCVWLSSWKHPFVAPLHTKPGVGKKIADKIDEILATVCALGARGGLSSTMISRPRELCFKISDYSSIKSFIQKATTFRYWLRPSPCVST